MPDKLDRFEGAIARESNIHGWGLVQCHTELNHTLTGCHVLSESRAGFGFGRSAYYVARVTWVDPARRDGRPYLEDVTFKVHF